jgi:hypothetical protein
LDRASIVPLSQQFYARLRERIPSRRLGEGAAPEPEFMETFGVIRASVCDTAPSHYEERRELRRQRFRAGEPDCAAPDLSGTQRDASGQR